MTHILPPDKLRDILTSMMDKIGEYRGGQPVVPEGALAIQQLATDALVAELRGLLQSGDDSNAVATLHHNGAILDRIAKLTTVPDLPSEHETLREQGEEDE